LPSGKNAIAFVTIDDSDRDQKTATNTSTFLGDEREEEIDADSPKQDTTRVDINNTKSGDSRLKYSGGRSDSSFLLTYDDLSSSVDITDSGSNHRIDFHVTYINGNNADFDVTLKDSGSDSATSSVTALSNTAKEGGPDATYSIPLSDFTSAGVDVTQVKYAQVELASGDNPGPDFTLGSIKATPFGFSPGMGLGALGLLYGGMQLRRCWKRQQAS